MNCKMLMSIVLVAGLFASQANANTANVGTYNLILKDDLSTSSDIEGSLFVGGDINMSGKSLDVGNLLPSDVSVNAVTVVGNITANDVKSGNGDIVYGGSVGTTNLINNGVGSAYQENQNTLQSEFDAVWASVEADSAYYASLDSTATFDSSDNNHKYLESGTSSELNVYNVGYTEILGGDIHFRDTPTVPVVINVDITGLSDLTLNSKVSFDADALGSLVLWNFFSADETITDIAFNGNGWRGSVLAPYANITSGTAALEGGFAALSYTGSVELHNNLYTYEPPTEEVTVPAPAGVWLLGLGLVFVVARKFKK